MSRADLAAFMLDQVTGEGSTDSSPGAISAVGQFLHLQSRGPDGPATAGRLALADGSPRALALEPDPMASRVTR